MSVYEKFNLFVATLALVVALGAIYFSVVTHEDRKSFDLELRRLVAIENAKIVVERNVAAINGLFNAESLRESDPQPSVLSRGG